MFGLEESITAVEDAWGALGPFDGLLGFSQGAMLAAIIAARSIAPPQSATPRSGGGGGSAGSALPMPMPMPMSTRVAPKFAALFAAAMPAAELTLFQSLANLGNWQSI